MSGSRPTFLRGPSLRARAAPGGSHTGRGSRAAKRARRSGAQGHCRAGPVRAGPGSRETTGNSCGGPGEDTAGARAGPVGSGEPTANAELGPRAGALGRLLSAEGGPCRGLSRPPPAWRLPGSCGTQPGWGEHGAQPPTRAGHAGPSGALGAPAVSWERKNDDRS